MPGHFTFYTTNIHSDIAHFDEAEYRHAIISLRYKLGDEISFTDGNYCSYSGKIIAIDKKLFSAEILHSTKSPETAGIAIICGIIKSTDRMEWMVEKCTEMGVKKILFVGTNKSDRTKINKEKLIRTAIAALKQCHGNYLPQIEEIKWEVALQLKAETKYIAAIENEHSILLSQLPQPTNSDHIFLVGPEGDFSENELLDAKQNGFVPLNLGKRILRTETAVIAIAANQI
ncbi:MAG: 16S rRNA (uracil(1498)-N(3))-methyltransferase [Bacteroidia bacterium]|jgi:16S rRNA (uracil1498-N3)-methyltransferase|nr:16S rRNA (uracil(1498)-N(3))-methyltransferase [Bacteroidia bacterium]